MANLIEENNFNLPNFMKEEILPHKQQAKPYLHFSQTKLGSTTIKDFN